MLPCSACLALGTVSNMLYGYARVSTKGQQRDGNSIEAQTKSLKAAGCEKIYSESFTGMTCERPQFTELLNNLVQGDTLVVTKLDRIARSTIEGSKLVNELISRGITVRVLNMGTLDSSPVGKMLISVMFAMSEFERDMIVQRTQEGLAIARQRPDFKCGRPEKTVEPELIRRHIALVESKSETVQEACKALGVGRSTYYKLRKDALRTAGAA